MDKEGFEEECFFQDYDESDFQWIRGGAVPFTFILLPYQRREFKTDQEAWDRLQEEAERALTYLWGHKHEAQEHPACPRVEARLEDKREKGRRRGRL